MLKKVFWVIFLSLATLSLLACGIPKDAYQTAVAERDAAKTELEKVRAELNTARQSYTLQTALW